MARKLKCYGAECEEQGLKYDAEELTKYNGKNYCSKCLKKKMERDKDYDALCDYIKNIFNVTFVDPFIKKQIKDFEAGGFTLKGMRSTLRYIVEILGIQLQLKYGIAMVRYRYHEAREYAENRNKQINQAKEVVEDKVIVRHVDIEKDKQKGRTGKRFSLFDVKIEEE